jgi:hypothetical protein
LFELLQRSFAGATMGVVPPLQVDAIADNSQSASSHIGSKSSRARQQVGEGEPRWRMIGVVFQVEFAEQAPTDILSVEAGTQEVTPAITQVERIVILVDAGTPGSHATRLHPEREPEGRHGLWYF